MHIETLYQKIRQMVTGKLLGNADACFKTFRSRVVLGNAHLTRCCTCLCVRKVCVNIRSHIHMDMQMIFDETEVNKCACVCGRACESVYVCVHLDTCECLYTHIHMHTPIYNWVLGACG